MQGVTTPVLGDPGLEQERREEWVLRIPERDLDAPEWKDLGAGSAEGCEFDELSSRCRSPFLGWCHRVRCPDRHGSCQSR